ncbi:MAG TPA: hypothetical protein VH596_02820 [Terriglobales bacterium]
MSTATLKLINRPTCFLLKRKGKKLSMVDREDLLNGFQFDNYCVLNNNINAVSAVECQGLVYHWKIHLTLETHIPQVQLVT